MEVLFENEVIRNKELAKEFYTYLYFRRPFRIVASVIYILALGLDLYRVLTFGGVPYIAIWVLCVGILLVIPYFRSPKVMLQRDAELYGGEVSVRTAITEDQLLAYGPDGVTQTMKFENIKGWIDTKNYILLYTKTKMVLFFRKDGFSKGSYEEFCAFLSGKGIKRRHM